jgi:ribosomal protein S12 methylthiotransferase accessory factor
MGLELNVRFPGGKRVDVEVGGFTIPTDQLPRDGGEASAPPPFYLFLGSIATCAGIYALGFCQSRNLSTEGLALSMDWDWDPKRPGPAKALLRLHLPQGFPEHYRDGIVKAMELCAVKKNIETPPEFRIEVEG